MPALVISTNIPRSNIPADFHAKMTRVMADTMSKPFEYCMVQIIPDSLITFGGTHEPCANATLSSIGHLGVEENKKYSKAIMGVLNELGIPSDRMFIFYHDVKAQDTGFNNSTFHGIL